MNIEFTYQPDFGLERPATPSLDPLDVRRRMRRLSEAGFSRVIAGDCGDPDRNMSNAAEMLRLSYPLGVELTHRSGAMDPVVAAARIASLDDGRLSLRVLQANVTQAGGLIDHEGGQRSMNEYMVLLKRLWSNASPFDYEGPFYRVKDGFVAGKGTQACDIPIRMDGLTGTALRVAARHATVFELAGGSRQDLARTMDRVNAASLEFGRAGKIGFSLRVDVRLGRKLPDRTLGRCAVPVDGDGQQIMAELVSWAEMGVTEFVIGGLYSSAEIKAFGMDVVQPLAAVHVPSPGRAPGVARSISA